MMMNMSAGWKNISADTRANKFLNRRYLYCSKITYQVAEYIARKKPQILRAVVAVEEIEATDKSSKGVGTDVPNQ